MKNCKILLLLVLVVSFVSQLRSQEYDENKTRAQIEKFQANPKLYYDKIKALTAKLDEANQNTLKVSEEYLALLDQKDSIITIYKNQLAKAKMNAGSKATVTPISTPVVKEPIAPVEPKKQILNESPYRVQLAAFKREDFVNFFTQSTKTFGVERLENRSVMEIQGFNTVEEASEFSKKMRALGFPGAFVTKYDNGVRQEGFTHLSKSGLTSSNAIPSKISKAGRVEATADTTTLSYPNYIPIGYQELMGDRNKQILQAAIAPPSVKNIPKPLTKFSPNQSDIDRTNAIPEGSILPASTPKAVAGAKSPKAANTATKTNSGSTSPSSAKKAAAVPTPPPPPPADPLDAAFEQMFKK